MCWCCSGCFGIFRAICYYQFAQFSGPGDIDSRLSPTNNVDWQFNINAEQFIHCQSCGVDANGSCLARMHSTLHGGVLEQKNTDLSTQLKGSRCSWNWCPIWEVEAINGSCCLHFPCFFSIWGMVANPFHYYIMRLGEFEREPPPITWDVSVKSKVDLIWSHYVRYSI